ncbi:MAG: hypothetical protein ACI8Z1_000054 [Candidatus Azotimanducaceae bacterium]
MLGRQLIALRDLFCTYKFKQQQGGGVKVSNSIEKAMQFFEACETGKGQEECKVLCN